MAQFMPIRATTYDFVDQFQRGQQIKDRRDMQSAQIEQMRGQQAQQEQNRALAGRVAAGPQFGGVRPVQQAGADMQGDVIGPPDPTGRDADISANRQALSEHERDRRLLAGVDPVAAKALNEAHGYITDEKRQLAANDATRFLSFEPGSEQQTNAIMDRITVGEQSGRDMSHTKELLDMDGQSRTTALNAVRLSTLSELERSNLALDERGMALKEGATLGVKKSAFEDKVELMTGLKKGEPGFIEAAKEIGSRQGTNITIGSGQPRAWDKIDATQFGDIMSAGQQGREMMDSINVMEALDPSTSALEPLKTSFASVMEGLGMDASSIADVATNQAFAAESTRVVNKFLAMQKGVQTEGDAQRMKKTIASLGDKKEAFEFKNKSMKAVAMRGMEREEFYNNARTQDDFSMAKTNNAWNKYIADNRISLKRKDTGLPLFQYEFKNRVREIEPGISEEELEMEWKAEVRASQGRSNN